MKVIVQSWDEDNGEYTCVTGKGKEIRVDPFFNGSSWGSVRPEELVGKRFKLKNSTDKLSQCGWDCCFIYIPTSSQWYELKDKEPVKVWIDEAEEIFGRKKGLNE